MYIYTYILIANMYFNSSITLRCEIAFKYGPNLQAVPILCVYNVCNMCQDHFYVQYHKTFSQKLLVWRKNVCVNKIDVTVKTQWLSDILIESYGRLRYINCSSAHIRIGFEFETNFDDMLLYQLATFNQFLTFSFNH